MGNSMESKGKFFLSDFESDKSPDLDEIKIKKDFEILAPDKFEIRRPFYLNIDNPVKKKKPSEVDPQEQKAKTRLEHEQMSIASNGHVIVTGSQETPYLRSWDPQLLEMTKIMKTPGEIKPFPAVYNSRCLLELQPQILVSAGRSSEVFIWNINKKRLLRKFEVLEEYKMFEATALEKIDNMHFVVGGVSHLLTKNIVMIYNQLTGIVTKFKNFSERVVKYNRVIIRPIKHLKYWLAVSGGAEIRFLHISTGKQFYSFIPQGKSEERAQQLQSTVRYGKDVLIASYESDAFLWELSVDVKKKRPNFKLLHKCRNVNFTNKMLQFNSRYFITMVEKEMVLFDVERGKVVRKRAFNKQIMSRDCRDMCYLNKWAKENIICCFANQIITFKIHCRTVEDD